MNSADIGRPIVRTKFGPNLARPLHLGHLRVALLTQAIAEALKGEFILRLEDTAQIGLPLTSETVETLCLDLKWAGVRWNEGLGFGGPHAPYVQSQRLPIYKDYLGKLRASGHCYYCNCPPERLEALRREQISTKSAYRGYDGHCRSRDLSLENACTEFGTNPATRFRVPKFGPDLRIANILSGTVTSYRLNLIEDFVLERSNGIPTYYLANVVDDHVMGINHMIRGTDGSASAPRQLLLYRAFDWPPPRFGFFPLLRLPHEEKGKVLPTIREFRDLGVPPASLVTYLLSLNVSKPADNTEEALALCSSLMLSGTYSKTPATFSSNDLLRKSRMNGRHALAAHEIEELLRQREIARHGHDFKTADRIRDHLVLAGISISDSPSGSSWRWRA